MKKKIVIISLSLFLLAVVIAKLYQTYAIDTTLAESSNSYTITLTDLNSTVFVPAKTSKTVIYRVKNINSGTTEYGVGYEDNQNVSVKVWFDSPDPASGTVNAGEYKFVKIKLSNNTTTDEDVTLTTILGYEHGGNLIVPTGITMITSEINEFNNIISAEAASSPSSVFMGTSIIRSNIVSVTLEKDNIVPTDATGSKSLSLTSADNVMMWWYIDENNKYDIHIGTDGGKISLSDNNNRIFRYLNNITSLDLSNIDTSNLTNMEYMFDNCSSLTSLDLSSFDTSNLTSMKYMFDNCSSLTSLDLSSFDTSNVTSMASMFYGCSSLTSLDLSNFDTSKVADMSSMFERCNGLTELDLSNFDTSSATTMYRMFNRCEGLTSLDLSNFNTSKVTTMKEMFNKCTGLVNLNISSFTSEVLTNTMDLTYQCSKLMNIDIRNMTFSGITTYTRTFNVPKACNIIVKDDTEKSWVESKFTSLTNVVAATSL